MASANNSTFPDAGQFGGPQPSVHGYLTQPDRVDKNPPRPGYPPPPPPSEAPPPYCYPEYPPPLYPFPSFSSIPIEPAGQQQQQQQVVMMNSGSTPTVIQDRRVQQSFCCHVTFACIVFWLCGFLFGGIAFLFAMCAISSSRQPNDARCLGVTSLTLSGVGLAIGLVAWGIGLYFLITALISNNGYDCPYYTCKNQCYTERVYSTWELCYQYFSSSCYDSDTGFCYFR